MPIKQINVANMHCRSCEIILEQNIGKLARVRQVRADQKKGQIEVDYNEEPNWSEIKKTIISSGYSLGRKNNLPWVSSDWRDYRNLLISSVVIAILILLFASSNIFNFSVSSNQTGLIAALLVGLVAGVSTCMAMVGGLVLGVAANFNKNHPEASARHKFIPHLFFNSGRLIGFAILGGVIGWLGEIFTLSSNVLAVLTIAVGLVMIILGLKLIGIFPRLDNFQIALPSSLAKKINFDQEKYSHKNALIFGAMTFFLPCGFTQAMQLVAIASGSFFSGALIMFLFAVGTTPGLLAIGALAAVAKGAKAKLFFMTAGLLVVILGFYNITNATQLFSVSAVDNGPVIANQEPQIVRMTQDEYGYSPKIINIEKNRPVKLIINSTNSYTCASSFRISAFKINKGLKPGENIIEFTPTQAGEIKFSCSMGMYTGKFIVK